MLKVLIVGATSGIAQAVARQYAQRGAALYLVGRDDNKLEQVANDLSVRGAAATHSYTLDINQIQQHDAMITDAQNQLGQFDLVLFAHGTLPVQEDIENRYNDIFEALQTNALSVISLLTRLTPIMEQQRSGTLAVISSVAGDRGRQSNYVYGTAKAAVTTFCQGLRNRLVKKGVQVLTIKPGFVDTPMTDGFDKGGPLWASPEKVAKDIINAVDKGRDVIYTPFFWRYIMLIIQHIPEFIFKHLSL